MGYKFKLARAQRDKLARARRRAEKFAHDLFSRVMPLGAQILYRCQQGDGTVALSKGDPLLVYTTKCGVKLHKQNGVIGVMTPAAEAAFGKTFSSEDVRLAEVASEPSPLDGCFDVVIHIGG
jgi:hypothetical protein